MPSEYIEQLGAVVGLGGGAGGGFFIIKWFAEWIVGRLDKKEAALDAGWQKYRETLERDLKTFRDRLDQVETQLRDCQGQHARSEAKVLRLEAIIQGQGEIKQLAAGAVAADRLAGRA